MVKALLKSGSRVPEFGAGASPSKNRSSNGKAFRWSRWSLRNCPIISLDEQGIRGQELIARLEAENAALRGSVVDLMLQIEALRI